MTAEPFTDGGDAAGRHGARPDTNRLVGWIREHPVGAFLAWFFPVGWTIAFIPMIAKHVVGLDLTLEPFLIAATWVGLLLPTLVITRLVDGPAGIDALRRRMRKAGASIGWYALALLSVPVTSLVLATIFYGLPKATPADALSAVVNGLLAQSAIGFITINLWEETAWMGFVQARLQARRGVLLGAVLTAMLFTLQHLPLFADNGAGVLLIAPVFFALAFPFRALVGWLYNRTGSLFLVGLLHAVGDGTGSGGFDPGLLPRLYDSSDSALLSNLAQALVGLAVIAATRARLGGQARSTLGQQP